MLKKIRSFILEEELTVHVYKNKVNVVNYESIGHFDNNKVNIRHNSGLIIIHGDNLSVSKMLDNEILVIGQIKNIEFR